MEKKRIKKILRRMINKAQVFLLRGNYVTVFIFTSTASIREVSLDSLSTGSFPKNINNLPHCQ